MQVLLAGTGGASGWPEQGCRCASCQLAAAGGDTRAPSRTVVDGVLSLAAGEPPDAVDGYQVRAVPGGWDVTGPDGQRLLQAAEPGAVPRPPDGTAPYDIALLDLLGDPFQLGLLRARGLVTERTAVAVAYADHRVLSSRELERRCGLWDVLVPRDGWGVTTSRSGEKRESRRPRRVLIIGGARSGKSAAAETRLAAEPDVSYVATGARPPAPDDPEWAARLAAHRERRPAWWRTVETTDLTGVLGTARGALLIDGIGTWLAAALDDCGAWAGDPLAAGRLAERAGELIAAWRQTRAYVVAVSDETGLGVVPETASGRLFRDELGRLNQALAAESEETEMIVAGRVVPLPLW